MEDLKTIREYLRQQYDDIVERCNNPEHPDYADNGGKGVKCLFKDFEEFYEHVTKEMPIDPETWASLEEMILERLQQVGDEIQK